MFPALSREGLRECFMLFKEISQKPLEYLALLATLLIGLVCYFIYAYDPHSQRRVVYVTAAAYFLWSLYHHYKRGDLEFSIIIEYLVFILFGLILLSSTLM